MVPSPLLRVKCTFAAVVFSLSAPAVLADELAEAAELLRGGQHQKALVHVDRVLAGKPGDPHARFLKGLIYTDQGNTSAAIDVFRKLTEDYPELPEPHNNLAVIYASQGEYDKARLALEKSIRTHPSYATAYENLGDVYARLASQAYDKALKLDAANAGAQNKLALVRELVSGASREGRPAVAVAAAPAAAAEPRAAPKPAAPPPAPAALAAAKPAVPSGAPEPHAALAALADWAAAWSRQDVDGYLASYAKDFRTPNGQPRADWEATRRERLRAPKSISVSIESARVTAAPAGRVNVTFLQHYRSDRFSARSRKTLQMAKSEDGRWRIVQEQVSN